MAVNVFVGAEFFDELRKSGCYYVDKTELIHELVQMNKSKVTLFTRPRRFGKTLTMTMLESFFDIRRDSRAVFEGLDIMKHEELCAEWMNRYPVLFLTLKDAEALRFETAYAKLKTILSDTCKRHRYLGSSEKVDPGDAERYQRLLFERATDNEVQNSLVTLCRMMVAHYGRPVILLIDEYDVPLAKASEEKPCGERYYDRMLEVIRGLLSTALKSNEYLKLAVVTGCLRIAKESIFTGVNNFKSCSVLDSEFSTCFGFTKEETDELLTAAGLSERLDMVRDWYDGYVFGETKMFCPWDVVNYALDAMHDPDLEPKNYWQNSSGNGIIRDFVSRTEFEVSDKFETLLNGGSITRTISDGLTYDSLHDTEDNLWSVLLMTGYLTKADPKQRGNTAALRIPNREVAGIFVGLGYGVSSNREQGLGRTDLVLRDKKNRRALIIEAKRSDSEAGMERDCREALDQITGKKYAEGLPGYRTILCYGVAFYQKSALVKKL